MEIGDRIRTGCASDWCGMATRKYQIIRETTDGQFVCQGMPEVIARPAGSKYVTNPMTGLFLRDKKEFTNVHEEIIRRKE